MPTTLTGLLLFVLLLFVVLLLPGFAFMIVKERNTPMARRSPFRETVEVAVASTVIGLAILAVFAGLRIAWPAGTPDVGRLVRDTGGYLDAEYVVVAWWAAGLLVVTTMAGGVMGWCAGRRPPHASKMSSWWEMFESWYPGFNTHVGCTLDDGSYVEGILNSYSDLGDETPDRDLILQAPIQLRFPSEVETRPHGAGAVCISARRIVMMTVTPLTTRRGEVTSSPAAEPSERMAVEAPVAALEADSPADAPARNSGRAAVPYDPAAEPSCPQDAQTSAHA